MATIAVIGMPGLQVHIELLAQTGFPSVPSVHFGEIMRSALLRLGANIGHHFPTKRAEHIDPGAHVSLFRRPVVPGTRIYPTPAEHLGIP